MTVSGSLAPTGVDAEAGLLLGYDDGRAASLLISLRNPTPGVGPDPRHQGLDRDPAALPPPEEHRRSTATGQEPETIDRPPLGAGYAHELIEVNECLRAGRTESAVMPLDDTLAVQRILNDACEQLGVFHREDAGVAV